MEAGFYKQNNDDSWVYGKSVLTPEFELTLDNYDTYTYPIDGWEYHTTAPQGYIDYMNSEDDNLFDIDDVEPPIDVDPHYKIYDYLSDDKRGSSMYINDKVPPHSIDYKKDLKQRLHPEYTFDENGFLIKCVYYTDIEKTTDEYGGVNYTYSNPILEYTATYTLNDTGYVDSRVVNRDWYLTDDTLSGNPKISQKYYDTISARAEGRRRRKNQISNLLIDTVGLIIMTSSDLNNIMEAETDAMDFMKEISPAINEYYEYGNRKDLNNNPCLLVQKIMASNYSRLDNYLPNNNTVTIRDYVLNRLGG